MSPVVKTLLLRYFPASRQNMPLLSLRLSRNPAEALRNYSGTSLSAHASKDEVAISEVKGDRNNKKTEKNGSVVMTHEEENDDEMEQEEMFVRADQSLGHTKLEWGGPRRGGRLKEPTRFGDWERKGRCTDF
eukprot:195377_1